MSGQKSGVFVLGVDGFHDIGFVGPEPDVVPVPRQQVRQRCTPGTRAHYRAAHQVAVSFFTKRCSSPRRNRPMFARCVQKTKMTITTLAMNTGDRGSLSQARIANGRTAAETSDARL